MLALYAFNFNLLKILSCPKLPAVCKTSDSILKIKLSYIQVFNSCLYLEVTLGKNLESPHLLFFLKKDMVGVPNFKRKPIIRPKLTPSMVYLIYNIMLKFSYIYHPKSVYPPILKTTSYPIKCER